MSELKVSAVRWKRARKVLAGIVVAGRHGGGVAAVAEVAQLQPAAPAPRCRGVTEFGAEDQVRVGVEAVGVVHRHARGVFAVERGIQAGGSIHAHFALIVVARQARQTIAAEAGIVAIAEIAEGIGLVQRQPSGRTLPNDSAHSCTNQPAMSRSGSA